jgi:hypothetical protein
MSKKSLDFSSKEDGYASRYTAWTDMKRRIVKLDGPYSPNLHDGEYLKLRKDFIEKHLKGTGFLGDCHYLIGCEMLKNVKIATCL